MAASKNILITIFLHSGFSIITFCCVLHVLNIKDKFNSSSI